jgi:hypothetical protein
MASLGLDSDVHRDLVLFGLAHVWRVYAEVRCSLIIEICELRSR